MAQDKYRRYFGLYVPYVKTQKIDGNRTFVTGYDVWGEPFSLLLDPEDIDAPRHLVRITISSYHLNEERDDRIVVAQLPKASSTGHDTITVQRDKIKEWHQNPQMKPVEGDISHV